MGFGFSRKKYTILNTAYGIVFRFVILITNFAIRTVFIHYLGIEYTGVSVVFADILTILSFAELGIGSAITYSLYKPIEEKNYRHIACIMRLYKQAYQWIAVSVLIIGVALIPFLDVIIPNHPNITEDLRLIFLLYVLNSAASYLLIYKSSLLIASQLGYLQSIINIIFCIIKAIIQIVCIIFYREFILYLIVEIIFNLFNNIVVSYIANRHFPELYKFSRKKLPREEIKLIFKNIKALSIYRLCGVLTIGLTSMLTSILVSIEMVGYVSNYTLIINQLYTFSLQFFNAATASIGNLAASKDKDRQEEIFNIIFFYASLYFCYTAVVQFCLLNEFVTKIWLNEQYQISPTIIALLCADFYFKGYATIFNTFRNANGLFQQGQFRPVFMILLNIIGAFILYRFWGLAGIFASLVLSRLITQIWYDPLILYKTIFRGNYICFIKRMLVITMVTIVSGLVCWYINHIFTFGLVWLDFVMHLLLSLIVTSIILGVIYRTQITSLKESFIRRINNHNIPIH